VSGRKTAEVRRKELRLAILRIKHGKARSGITRVSILSVAREAGISAALIHNHYPSIADDIRREQGRDSRAKRDAISLRLKKERDKNRKLRGENSALHTDIRRLASINEVLLAENRSLRVRAGVESIVPFVPRKRDLPTE
jgi:AcrR family transcriptional regulator